MGVAMSWEPSMISLAPEDFIVEGLAELLSKAGFRETRREYKRRGKAHLVIVTGEREDPFQGKETLAVALLRGKPPESWLRKALRGEDKTFLVALDGLEYSLEGVNVLSPDWLAETFNRYAIEPPRTLLEKFLPREYEEEGVLKEFVLDGPLVEPLSSKKLVDEAKNVISYKYGISREETRLKELRLEFRPVYIVSWVRESDSGKAFVDGKRVVLKTEGELKGLAMKVLLEDVATVLATEVRLKEGEDPRKFVVEEAAKREWLDLRVVHSRKAYVPESAVAVFSMGPNEATVVFDFKKGRVSAEAEPLSEERLTELARDVVRAEIGEEPLSIEVVRRGRFTVMRGKTERYLFEVELNSYSGSLRRFHPALTEEAMFGVVLSKYDGARVIGVERRSNAVFIDLLTEKGVLTVKLDQRTGNILETSNLGAPIEVLRRVAGDIVEVAKNLELKACHVIDHGIVKAEFEGEGFRASITYEGETGRVLEEDLEIEKNIAVEVALRKYRGFAPIFIEESEEGFTVTLEGDRNVVKVFVSRSGEVVELDRFLKKEVVEEIALSKIREVEPSPSIEGLKLSNHWEVEFTGVKAFGRLTVHRTSGEVLDFDYQYIESTIAKSFEEFIRTTYGDSIEVEWVAHNIEEGYAGIKGIGRRGIYFGKYNTLTGELIEHDFIPGSGITSKIKLAQVEGKYAVK